MVPFSFAEGEPDESGSPFVCATRRPVQIAQGTVTVLVTPTDL